MDVNMIKRLKQLKYRLTAHSRRHFSLRQRFRTWLIVKVVGDWEVMINVTYTKPVRVRTNAFGLNVNCTFTTFEAVSAKE